MNKIPNESKTSRVTIKDIQDVYSFCQKYYNENKKFPSKNKIVENTTFDNSKITFILKYLVKKENLELRNNRYYFPFQKKYNKKTIEPIIKKVKKVDNKLFSKTNLNKFFSFIGNINKITIFKFFIFIVFISFLYLGIKYNYEAFKLTKHFPDNLISAIGFFVFGIVSFECFIYFTFVLKKWLGISFFIIFIIIFFINFLNIFSNQFETYQNLLYNENTVNAKINSRILEKLEKEEKELETEFENRIYERENYNKKLLDNPDNKNLIYGIWNITNKYIPDLENKLKINRDKQEKLFSDETTFLNENKTTFYDFLNSFTKIKVNTLKFIHLVLPALVLDIISSISLGLLFFMKNN